MVNEPPREELLLPMHVKINQEQIIGDKKFGVLTRRKERENMSVLYLNLNKK